MPQKLPAKKVAIVHDWLIGGGAEKVVLALHQLFPEAPIYTSYCTDEWRQKLNHKVVTGYLQRWPFSKLRKFLPVLRQRWFQKLDLSEFDLVISSSGAEAKGVRVPPGTIHVNYCHAPTHYYWSRYQTYLQDPGFGPFNWLARIGLRLLLSPMRRWDFQAAQRPDYLVANSNYTKAAVRQYYNRQSVVIHPPVDVQRFTNQNEPGKRTGFVIAGRQTPYKRFDLAVQACSQLNLPLTVVGNGPQHNQLLKMAGPSITFLNQPSDADIVRSFQHAEGFIFPGVDDFGITAVEAMAAGTPVIAFHEGGALDYVTPGKTGLFFNEQTAESLGRALDSFQPKDFSATVIKHHAANFSADHFKKSLTDFLGTVLKNPPAQ